MNDTRTVRPRRLWRWLKRIVLGVLVFGAGVYLYNASWWLSPPPGKPKLLAHRGVHQTYDRQGLGRDDCTATRIDPPTHDYLENTLRSMEAAFADGADLVELDVHPTTDGQFAVLHDWTVDCRTDGTGVTREHDMAYLKTLDIGYGYTADGGKTYPFRGKGVGLMPELKEVLARFPDKQFLVNYKSKEAREGDLLAALLTAHPEWRAAVWGAYGGEPPTRRAAELIPGLATFDKSHMKDCAIAYVAEGWTGYMPDACRNTVIMVPLNIAGWMWGWPNRFLERMADAGTTVILIGDYGSGDPGSNGIDTAEDLARVPEGFDGIIWTNKIEVVGRLMKKTAN